MKKKALTPLLLSVVVAALCLSGCSWTQRGAVAGGAVGAAIGGGWGYAASAAATTAQTALMGGAAGTATGALVGDQFDQADSREANRDLDNLRAQLTQREDELAQLQAGNDPRVTELSGKAAELQGQLDALSSQNQELSGTVSSLSGEKDSLAQKKAELEAQLAEINKAKEDAISSAAKLIDQNAGLAEKSAELEKQAAALRDEIAAKEANLASLQTAVQEKDGAVDQLRKDLAEMNVQLEETNRGLTLTILDQLLYKPGQASLSPEGTALIARVSDIIQAQFPGREIIVEGHTDNQPIRYSKWTSNWELASARALGIVHCMVREHGFEPTKISAMSFGEFRPAANNSTPEGRSLNRRSVILILPDKVGFQKQVASVATP